MEYDDGTLTIENVSIQDGGTYTCQVHRNCSTKSNQTSVVKLRIISLPLYTIHAHMAYNLGNCTSENLQLIEKHFAPSIHKLVCGQTNPVCTVFLKKIWTTGQVCTSSLDYQFIEIFAKAKCRQFALSNP